jgi:glycosyltransferase involved in cell wall biosynthesis
MKVGVVLPRGMHFSPKGATSIDIVARDLILASRYRESSFVVGEAVEDPYDDVDFRPVETASHVSVVSGAIDILNVERPDVVVVHQHPESAARIARALEGTPVLLHRHGLLKQKRGLLSRWLKERQFRCLSGFVFVSDFLRERFLTSFPRYRPISHVVHNALDTDDWSPSPDKTKTVVFAGRARADKGIGELLDAFRSCDAPGWQLVLILAAQTEAEKQYVAKLVGATADDPTCRIVVNATLSEVREQMAKALIGAIPSIVEEGFHRAAVEAMACGCATIATDRGGAPEATGGHALLLPEPDSDSIRAALQRLIDDEPYRSELAAAGRRHVEAHLRSAGISSQYDRLLESIVEKPGQTG